MQSGPIQRIREWGRSWPHRGILAFEEGRPSDCSETIFRSLEDAQRHGDRYLEAEIAVNLSAIGLEQDHYEDALEQSQVRYRHCE